MTHDPDLPQHALDAADFAEGIAQRYASKSGNPKDLFVALAGFLADRDREWGAQVLLAVEEIVSRRLANG